MKVSIITVAFNSAQYIEDCIKSVLSQSYPNIEYIVIDGGSTDGTVDIIKKFESKISKWISEPDEGIYDALNKGIKLASGTVIGILHSDDFYTSNKVLEKVSNVFIENPNAEGCYGDLCYVYPNNSNKIIRYWRAGDFDREKTKYGWMPPHPTCFFKTEVYKNYGRFDKSYKIASDYEILLRFIYKHKIKLIYLNEVITAMRLGGKSNKSVSNILMKMREDYKIMKKYRLPAYLTLPFKNLRKLPQFFIR